MPAFFRITMKAIETVAVAASATNHAYRTGPNVSESVSLPMWVANKCVKWPEPHVMKIAASNMANLLAGRPVSRLFSFTAFAIKAKAMKKIDAMITFEISIE